MTPTSRLASCASARRPAWAIAVALLALVTRVGAAPAPIVLPPGFEDQTLVSPLDRPTGFAFLPDGRVLVTEQESGIIWLVLANHTVAVDAPITVPDVRTDYVERGLLAIAVDPGWPQRPYVYVHYTSTLGHLRLLRYTAIGDLGNANSGNLVLGSPYEVLEAPDDQPPHNGGALRFGPDGRLYYSLGEDFGWCPAQDSTSLLGRVLRLDVSRLPAGAGGPPPLGLLVPADNPYATHPDSAMQLTYAMGFRNPFRFMIDSGTGLLYLSDVGDATWEELDEIGPGFNGGWPWREGPAAFAAPPSCNVPAGGLDEPIDSYDHGEGVVIISAGVLRRATGSYWPPHWEGNAFYADFAAGWMRMLHKQSGAWQRTTFNGLPDPAFFATGLRSPVDFVWGADGDLWYLSHEDATYGRTTGGLHRIHATTPLGVGEPRSAPLELAVSPNPSRESLTLRFALPEPGPARLAIYDVSGRLVARLFERTLAAGTHVEAWDGRGAEGRIAPAGVYLARLATGRRTVTARIARVR